MDTTSMVCTFISPHSQDETYRLFGISPAYDSTRAIWVITMKSTMCFCSCPLQRVRLPRLQLTHFRRSCPFRNGRSSTCQGMFKYVPLFPFHVDVHAVCLGPSERVHRSPRAIQDRGRTVPKRSSLSCPQRVEGCHRGFGLVHENESPL